MVIRILSQKLLNNIINHDPFFVLADPEHYVSVQDQVSDN